jgi:ribosomal protein S18 acetylase RimI-like enzyme
MTIRPIDIHQPAEMQRVAQLFLDMYREFETLNIQLPLAEKGHEIWLNQHTRMLGKLNHLLVAEDQGKLIGFAAGSLRVAPEFLGSVKVGVISYVYMTPDYRKLGKSHNLVNHLIQDLAQSEPVHIELDVFEHNEPARAFWNKLGFTNELIKMIRKS